MRKHGKKFTAARAQIAAERTYTIEEAFRSASTTPGGRPYVPQSKRM